MPFCPKCEQEYRAGFTTCADCRVALVPTLARPERMEAVEEDFAEGIFAPEDDALICPVCLNEFAPGAKRCVPCGDERLSTTTQEHYRAVLDSSPLASVYRPAGDRELTGRVLVARAHSPAEAAWISDQLESMGVAPEVGSDLSDKFEDASLVGIYVLPDDVEAARMLLPEDHEEFEAPRGDARPYEGRLAQADAYRQIHKYEHAQRLLGEAVTLEPNRPDAYLALARLYADLAKFDKALELVRDARALRGPKDESEAPFLAAVLSLRDADLRPRFQGALAEQGMNELKLYLSRRPRHITALKLLFEAQVERGEKEPARATSKHMRKINVTFFNDAPRYAALAARVEG